MESISALTENLLQMWQLEQVEYLPGATSEELRMFQEAHEVALPNDMRSYLERANGMPNNIWDEAMIAFHSISRIVPICDEMKDHMPQHRRVLSNLIDAEHIYIFADYLISSHYYTIRLLPTPGTMPNEVLWVSGDEFMVVGNSFSDFLARYISDRESILFPNFQI